MERRVIVPLLLGLLVIAVAFFGLYSTGTMEKDQSLSCDRTDLVGAFVKNSRGDVIGVVSRVEDFGDQSFAIINHGSESSYGEGGRYTPVPVGALKIPEARMDQSDQMKTVVLNRTERALEAAPSWDPTKMDDPTYEARIAGFFGVQPVLCG
jgi:hypothetical protein